MERRELRYSGGRMVVFLALVLSLNGAVRPGAQQLIWIPQGAAPITKGQNEGISENEVEGGVNAIAAHPSDANITYVGTVNGGVWRTSNARDDHPRWEPLTDAQGSLSVGALEFDPSDATHRTLVVGIGRASSNGRAGGALIGLLRTTDGGTTWTPIDGGGTLAGLNMAGVAPRGATIVACVNAAQQPSQVGIWRTQNLTQWNQVSGAGQTGLPAGGCTDLASDPASPDRLFANAGRLGIYRSADRGGTWGKISDAAVDAALTSAVNVKLSVGGASNIFVAVVGPAKQLSAVFRSGDDGATWTAMGVPATSEGGIHPGAQGGIHISIAADLSNANVVYVGGDSQPPPTGGGFPTPNSIGAADYSGRLFRGDASQPLARRWVHLTHRQMPGGGGTAHGSAPHADSRKMVMAPDGSLLEGDDGGIYRRTTPRSNAGDWFSMIGNLQATEFHSIAWDANTHSLIGGAQDTGTPQQTRPPSVKWTSVSTSDGGVVAVDSTSTPGRSVRYSSYYKLLGLTRRIYDTAGTLQSQQLVTMTPLNNVAVSPQFYTPLVLNGMTPTRLVLGGTNGVFESFDQGDTITLIAGIMANANAIAYGAAGNADALYVGAGTDVFVRTSGSAALVPSSSYAGGFVSAVAIDPRDAQTVFVASASGVFRTINAGGTWTTLTGNLPSLLPGVLRSAAFLTASTVGAIAVGADSGVFVADGPAFTAWRRLGGGLPRVPAYHLEYSAPDHMLVAGTLGRGAWTVVLPAGQPVITTAPPAASDGVGTAQQAPLAPAGGVPVQLGSGVLIDPAQRRVYIASPQRGVESVDSVNGRVIWRSDAAAKPVGIVDRRLVAQADPAAIDGSLRVAILDVATGRETMRPQPVPLPPGVRALVGATPEGRFALTLERGDLASTEARLSWAYERPAPERGVRPGTSDALSDPLTAPPPPQAPAIPQQRAGAFRLNVASGAIAADDAFPPPPPVAVEATPRPTPERMPDLPPTQVLSADGRHILASERVADDATWDRYQWTIVERDTGRRVGQLRTHVSVAPFAVIGSTVIFETAPFTRRNAGAVVQEALKIRAVDLASGRELWSREIRDTTARGPFPP